MPNSAQIVATAAAVAAILYVARRRRRKSFAPMSRAPPPATAAALAKDRWLALRHAAVESAVAAPTLEAAFDAIRAAFAPQQVDYSNTAYGKDHWKLSCFMEYSNGVAAGRIDLAKGAPMLAVCAGILGECDAAFLRWYATLHPVPRGAERALTRLQSFVTRARYRCIRPWARVPSPEYPTVTAAISRPEGEVNLILLEDGIYREPVRVTQDQRPEPTGQGGVRREEKLQRDQTAVNFRIYRH